jgi:hypothetical protein
LTHLQKTFTWCLLALEIWKRDEILFKWLFSQNK